ncbi:pleckstrin homology and RUN domain containing M1 [Nomia melanderi]|uniref:pleckstrin homology and RUN domain containing M1 n=1 Tax=Nomia melanderi TaxID=2448451 RepID=UPI0013041188|nr:pleckstrin homology domain-containing family M member 1 [Nomia melanderi]XP_031834551.1 pleckstrin homology domain-containing family M member 1 [Nomia melanderi]
MNSFLKTMSSMTNKRNALVKQSLQKQLNVSVMEMQGVSSTENSSVGNCEESMTLCSVLEAIFLHGLKDSLLNRVTEVLSGPDFDAIPQPSFWGPLLVFSHRQIIDQIQAFSQLTTEVGYCRAWIRLALNEGLLASYFCSIRRDNSALKPYYNQSAFIRDVDLVEVTQRLIETLDYIRFELACNGSLLNYWSTTPLLLAGIWSPPMKSCPVYSAVDIAKTVTTELTDNENFDEVETASSIGSLGSFNSSQIALNTVGSITEDEALKIILATKNPNNIGIKHLMNSPRDTSPLKMEEEPNLQKINKEPNSQEIKDEPNLQETEENKQISSTNGLNTSTVEIDKSSGIEDSEIETNIVQNHETLNDTTATAVGNSLIRKLGWSTSFEDCESSLSSPVISHDTATDAPRTPGDGATYESIVQSYHIAGNSSTPNLQEFLKKYPEKQTTDNGNKAQLENKIEINLDEQLGKLPKEKGLDIQNYCCFECGHAIGMTFSKAHVCSYSGYYYCSKCMSQNEYIIPSRVIYNWDLKHYPVCNKCAAYLQNCSALLDFKVLNPRIYMAVDTMAQLQSLRIQLNLLRAYLFTCREPIIESLQKKVAPRDYLYEHVHQYSVSDLLDIPNGILAQQLQKVIEFTRKHVVNCWLCSQKGFICEICNNPKVIYPFDMESTYRCGACNAVFHADCLNAHKPCPKCERRRKRIDLPLLDVGCTDLPMDGALTMDANE